MLKSFNPFKIDLLESALNYLGDLSFLNLEYDIDRPAVALAQIDAFFNKKLKFSTSINRPDFPQRYFSNIEIPLGDMRIRASGESADIERAQVKAFGEFLERSSSFAPLDLFKKNNFDLSSTSNVVSTQKIRIQSLTGKQNRQINEANLYYGVKGGEHPYSRTTSGCAGYFDKDTAVLKAWLELIERDAFMVHWLNGIAPRKISIMDDYFDNDEDLKKIKSEIQRYKIELEILDITSDIGIPVVLCIMHDHSNGSYIGCGASAGFDFKEIFLSAYGEALGTASFTYTKSPTYTLQEDYEPFKDKTIDRETRMLLYLNPENFKKIEFFLSNPLKTSVDDCVRDCKSLTTTKDKLEHLVKIFKERYIQNPRNDVFVYEFKNKLLQKFSYHVVRVMSDGLYPIYLNEHFADPNHPRLEEFSKFKGLKTVSINKWPHLFP